MEIPNTDSLPIQKLPEAQNPTEFSLSPTKWFKTQMGSSGWFTIRDTDYLNDYMSDTARFTILLLHGCLWCDMDIVLLRDMRPLTVPHPVHGKLAFGEQCVERAHIADYNSAVISTAANSSFSSFSLKAGVCMGMNFCPKVLGRMTWKEGRLKEFQMLDNTAFDPSTCTVNLIYGRKYPPCSLSHRLQRCVRG